MSEFKTESIITKLVMVASIIYLCMPPPVVENDGGEGFLFGKIKSKVHLRLKDERRGEKGGGCLA